MGTRSYNFAVPVVSALLVIAMAVANGKRVSLADTQPYHANVLDAVKSIPSTIGGWKSEDVGLPEFALKLLKPNVIVHRRYRDPDSGNYAQLTLVHTKDARSLIDHYPPSCYPSFGWKHQFTEKQKWKSGSWNIPGADFGFSSANNVGETREIVVRNFIILHQHGLYHDHKEVRLAAADFTRRMYGAAQMSVMLEATMNPEHRDAIFQKMLDAVGPAIRTILAVERETAPDNGHGD